MSTDILGEIRDLSWQRLGNLLVAKLALEVG
jgi:hypothetical protein